MSEPTNETELLPCPFCGSKAEIGTASVFCSNDNCGATIWATPYSEVGIPKAIGAWNKRTVGFMEAINSGKNIKPITFSGGYMDADYWLKDLPLSLILVNGRWLIEPSSQSL